MAKPSTPKPRKPTAKKSSTAPAKRPKPVVTLAIRPVGAAPAEQPRYTTEQVSQLVDEIVDAVNEGERKAGAIREEVADQVFRKLYLNSVALALDPRAPVPPGVTEVLERAGRSMAISAYEFRRWVKAAAMKHHLRSQAWDGLPFDTKLELVRLLADAKSFGNFERAVLYTNTANIGPKAVRDFVNDLLPETESSGRPRGLTVKGARSITAPVIRLSDEEERQRLARRAASLDDDDREKFVEEIETAAQNLARLVREIRTAAKRKPNGH